MTGDTHINIGTINIASGETAGEILKDIAPRVGGDSPSDGPATSAGDNPSGSELAASLEEAEERIEEARITREEEPDPQKSTYANARRNFLRNVIKHVNKARKHEGFQTNHYRRPRSITQISEIQKNETRMADESLQRACASCALKNSCSLKGNLSKWIDHHPFAQTKPANKNKTRPGSSRVLRTESRDALGKRLDADPMAHCYPPKPATKQKAA